MALNKEATIGKRYSSGLGWRASEALRRSALAVSNFTSFDMYDDPLKLSPNGHNGVSRFGTTHTFGEDNSQVVKTQALLCLELQEIFRFEQKTVAFEPKPSEYKEYEGWIRWPEEDQPELIGTGGGNHHFPTAIPQQVAFLSLENTLVHMSATHALRLGLIDEYDEATAKLSEHSIQIAEKYTSEHSSK